MSDILKIEDDLSYSFLFSICYLNQWYFFKAMTKKSERGERKEGKRRNMTGLWYIRIQAWENLQSGWGLVGFIVSLLRFSFIDKSQQFCSQDAVSFLPTSVEGGLGVFVLFCFWRFERPYFLYPQDWSRTQHLRELYFTIFVPGRFLVSWETSSWCWHLDIMGSAP